MDLPEIIAYRESLIPESEREKYIAGDAFDPGWIESVRKDFSDAPLLVTASGFFHYFDEEAVLKLIRKLQNAAMSKSFSMP